MISTDDPNPIYPAPNGSTAQFQAREAAIRYSHARSAAFGLCANKTPDFSQVMRSDFNTIVQANNNLFQRAAPVMKMLYDQISGSHSMLVLTDSAGTILHALGDNDFLAKAEKVALAPGVNWAEQSKGTNAIGTAIANAAPTIVHGQEHYFVANHFLTCSAAPIFGPSGELFGVLDVTSDQRAYQPHTLALMRMSARLIENGLFSDNFRDATLLHFHEQVEFIGTLQECVIAIGASGKLTGANRNALHCLGLSEAAVRANTVTNCFGVTVGQLHDSAHGSLSQPLHLHLTCGKSIWALVRPAQAAHAFSVLKQTIEPRETKSATTPNFPIETPAAQHQPKQLINLRTGDPAMHLLLDKVSKIRDKDISLLILGETGTGKELLAATVHKNSARAQQPFVDVNCASIPESLIEAELFGYEEGAFTGAKRKGAIGKILQANGGTLFLDEVGDMPLSMQSRLLRVLQERRVTPLGSTKSIAVDVSLICATHRNLRDMIANSQFREDLFYRLNGLVVRIPALRQRTDLMAIAHALLKAESGARTLSFSAEVIHLLNNYDWPGNIRHLANIIRTAVAMSGDDQSIEIIHLSDDFVEEAQAQAALRAPVSAALSAEPTVRLQELIMPVALTPDPIADSNVGQTLKAKEIGLIQQALEAAHGNISIASKALGISRNTIYRKLHWNRKD
jgi:sigma-54 dependent transcriptional regulator, acetoin dehydrogenase operon transcriptional activator AcoR